MYIYELRSLHLLHLLPNTGNSSKVFHLVIIQKIFAVILVTKISRSSILCDHFLQAYAIVNFAKVLEIKNIVRIISELKNTCREIGKLLFLIQSLFLSLITSCTNSFHSSAITT